MGLFCPNHFIYLRYILLSHKIIIIIIKDPIRVLLACFSENTTSRQQYICNYYAYTEVYFFPKSEKIIMQELSTYRALFQSTYYPKKKKNCFPTCGNLFSSHSQTPTFCIFSPCRANNIALEAQVFVQIQLKPYRERRFLCLNPQQLLFWSYTCSISSLRKLAPEPCMS